MKSIYYMHDPKKITKDFKENNVSDDEFVRVMLYLKNKGLVNYKSLEIPIEVNLTDKGMEYIVSELKQERQEEFNRIIAITGSILALIACYNFLKEFITDTAFLKVAFLVSGILILMGFLYLVKFLYLNLIND